MPRDLSLGLYQVNFTMVDGPHIAAAHAPRYATPEQKAAVHKRITTAMRPAMAENPEGNPDIKITEIKLVNHPDEITKAVNDLKEANPNRVGAEEHGVASPNLILHEPSLTENIAAQQTPG